MAKKQPNLRPLLIERDSDRGGVVSMGLGRLGGGKTNALIHVARSIFNRKVRVARELKRMNPAPDESTVYAKRLAINELVFWIGHEDCQWRRLPEWTHPLLFVERGLRLDFFRDGKPFCPMTIPFDGFKDLVKHAQPNRVNVVYLPGPHKVRDFIVHLIKNPTLGWASVFVDECESICPGYETGKVWHQVDDFVKSVKRSRKRRVSIYTTTQVKALMDHRFVSLVMFWLIHTGCRAIPQTRVNQPGIDNLEIDEAWLATSSQFQKVNFPFYGASDDMVVLGLDKYEAPKPPSTKSEKLSSETPEKPPEAI